MPRLLHRLLPAVFIHAAVLAAPLPLANGGFEDGLSGWTLKGAPPGAVTVGAEAASLGKSGLRVHDESEARWTLESPPVPARPGALYALEFWAKNRGASGAINVGIAFLDADGKRLKGGTVPRYWPGVPIKTGGWFGKSVAKSVAPEGTVAVAVMIAPIMRKTRSAEIDDLRLVEEVEGETPPSRTDALLAEVAADPSRGAPPPAIVLKLDDLADRRGQVHPRWRRVADFARERGVKIDLGIVANSLEGEKPAYFQWIKDQRATGLVGFWWHGWDHAEWKDGEKRLLEFSGSGYEHQKRHHDDSLRLAREKLGFPFVAFGAPFNSTDGDTAKVLAGETDIRVWMYGRTGATRRQIVLGRAFSANIEQPTFVANHPEFIEGYAHNRGAGYFVLQGHPMQWDDGRFGNFTRIVDFLIGQKAEFVFAEEFATRADLEARVERSP